MQLIDLDTDEFVLAVTVAGTKRSYTRAELVEVLEVIADVEMRTGLFRRSEPSKSKSDPVNAEIRRIKEEGSRPWIAKLAAVVREIGKQSPAPASEQRRLARILDAMTEPAPEQTTSRLASSLEALQATEPDLVKAIAAFVKRYPGLR